MAWHAMLGRARSLIGILVKVRRMTNTRFSLPIWTGPDTGEKADVEPLERGAVFSFCEVRESADFARICGRIDGVGWVNLAYRYAHRSGNPVWYVWPVEKGGKGCKGRGKGGKGGKSESSEQPAAPY